MQEDLKPTNLAKYTAEFTGTFFLVFTIGCNVATGSIGAAISIGAMLMAMIFALGSVSGAHLNPAVSLAVLVSGRNKISPVDAVFYMISQILGGLVGIFLARSVAGGLAPLQPGFYYTSGAAAAVEVIYTCALCYVVLNVATTKDAEPKGLFGLAIGFTVASAAISIGPISGCSLNPAVSVAFMAAGYYSQGLVTVGCWFMYIFAPFIGALLAAMAFWLVRGGLTQRFEYGPDEHEEEVKPIIIKERDLDLEIAPESQPRTTPKSSTRDMPKKASILDPSTVSVKMERSDFQVLPPEMLNHELTCGIKWRKKQEPVLPQSDLFDVDLSCILYDEKMSRQIEAVYFGGNSTKVKGMRHSGDDAMGKAQGEKDNEMINFVLSQLDPKIWALVFVAVIYTPSKTFRDLDIIKYHLNDKTADNTEMCHFERADFEPKTNAVIATVLYRQKDQWIFQAVDECHEIKGHSSWRTMEPYTRKLLETIKSQAA